jgi:hypothetical protein
MLRGLLALVVAAAAVADLALITLQAPQAQ